VDNTDFQADVQLLDLSTYAFDVLDEPVRQYLALAVNNFLQW
jgi:hypothetical protein